MPNVLTQQPLLTCSRSILLREKFQVADVTSERPHWFDEDVASKCITVGAYAVTVWQDVMLCRFTMTGRAHTCILMWLQPPLPKLALARMGAQEVLDKEGHDDRGPMPFMGSFGWLKAKKLVWFVCAMRTGNRLGCASKKSPNLFMRMWKKSTAVPLCAGPSRLLSEAKPGRARWSLGGRLWEVIHSFKT